MVSKLNSILAYLFIVELAICTHLLQIHLHYSHWECRSTLKTYLNMLNSILDYLFIVELAICTHLLQIHLHCSHWDCSSTLKTYLNMLIRKHCIIVVSGVATSYRVKSRGVPYYFLEQTMKDEEPEVEEEWEEPPRAQSWLRH
jgi:hypothetical protein